MRKITGGIYFLYDGDNLVYIGQSGNIFERVGRHIKDNVKKFDNWEYQIVEDKEERNNLEGYLIKVFKPKYNQKGEYTSLYRTERRNYTRAVQVADKYLEIKKYPYIPVSFLDEVFHLKDIGFGLIRNGFIPDEVLYDETLFGYTKRCVVDKNWVLDNLDHLINGIGQIHKTCFNFDGTPAYSEEI